MENEGAEMDIIEFAMNMEKDGKIFYEKHAAAATEPELKQILQTSKLPIKRTLPLRKRFSSLGRSPYRKALQVPTSRLNGEMAWDDGVAFVSEVA